VATRSRGRPLLPDVFPVDGHRRGSDAQLSGDALTNGERPGAAIPARRAVFQAAMAGLVSFGAGMG